PPVAYRPETPGLGDDAAQRAELLGGGAAGLVRHHVLARPHGLDCERGAVARDRGDEDQPHRRILEQAALVGDARDVGTTLEEAGQRLRLAVAPITDALAAECEQPAGHFINVTMIEPDRRKPDRP